MAVRPIPEGYRTVTPYLIVTGADRLLGFILRAFSATEQLRMEKQDGTIGHAELRIGDSLVMLAEASEMWPAMHGNLHLYVEDCDTVYRRALEAGATSVQEMADQFYGDRTGAVRDPTGNLWWIATQIEDVDSEEMTRRVEAWKAGQQR